MPRTMRWPHFREHAGKRVSTSRWLRRMWMACMKQLTAMPLTMHGRVCESRCTRCNKVYPDETIYEVGELPKAGCCKKLLRPHIVWFGEMPLFIPEIERRLEACDLFVTIGTSGNVYPAAGFLLSLIHISEPTR